MRTRRRLHRCVSADCAAPQKRCVRRASVSSEFRRGRPLNSGWFDQVAHLQSGGRTESILMSLPPQVRWAIFGRRAGGEEARLTGTSCKTATLAEARIWIVTSFS